MIDRRGSHAHRARGDEVFVVQQTVASFIPHRIHDHIFRPEGSFIEWSTGQFHNAFDDQFPLKRDLPACKSGGFAGDQGRAAGPIRELEREAVLGAGNNGKIVIRSFCEGSGEIDVGI